MDPGSPFNIHVEEFYTQPGSYVKSAQGQQNYNSLNYTEVADALSTKGINVVFQRVSANDSGEYSLSSNTDLTQDVLDRIQQAGQPRPFCVGDERVHELAEVFTTGFEVRVEPEAGAARRQQHDVAGLGDGCGLVDRDQGSGHVARRSIVTGLCHVDFTP